MQLNKTEINLIKKALLDLASLVKTNSRHKREYKALKKLVGLGVFEKVDISFTIRNSYRNDYSITAKLLDKEMYYVYRDRM